MALRAAAFAESAKGKIYLEQGYIHGELSTSHELL